MNLQRLTDPDVQQFIIDHENDDPYELVLRGKNWPDLPIKEIAEQIKSHKKARKKIPQWYHTSGIVFPESKFLEQASSQETAQFKAGLMEGSNLLDLTGGSGVDTYYLSRAFEQVHYVEPNENLLNLTTHNFRVLEAKNIVVHRNTAEGFLAGNNMGFDWIYLDPSRRVDGSRVMGLEEHSPNLIELFPHLKSLDSNIILKLSPMSDIESVLKALPGATEVHAISANNECKEILLTYDKNSSGIQYTAVNLVDSNAQRFTFLPDEERELIVNYANPSRFLYEPNASVLKLGGFKSVAKAYDLSKLHTNSHLYTSDQLIGDFPGRTFVLKKATKFSWKVMEKYRGMKINLTTRNFPHSVKRVRSSSGILEGGNLYGFLTTLSDNNLYFLECEKQDLPNQ